MEKNGPWSTLIFPLYNKHKRGYYDESYNLMINVHESKSKQNRFVDIVSFQTNCDRLDVTSIVRKIAIN
jgi:hypothetical protein